ncbi:RAM signaling pathway protein-domain-containing protein [Lentinula lateritia]|uniref:RAM signaling pathway protein-domain-containing protein n=1 Tax=Lentinula aff. lateritia TaxID=2804960 RepID=A0ACC1U279_9AGAR|nr:RAM signaling pathway protein-domain-containing protein [Lentinula aff. lateritia]KAJ3854972.1 RAM signaling pathway protein-domain-containing protein [Lentinula lateritia]
MSLLDAEHSVQPSPSSRKNGSFPPISLNSSHIQEALARSNDGGVTLVLMKKNFADVDSDAAEELATIGREFPEDEISLGHNRLTTLPMEFALLSRLRYLNLKSNCFSVFPDVLTLMPAIDTLDISHNKIKRLPSQPGHLVNLRVFCFSRNKVTRLPVYLSRFHNLTVLQADKNPIEWPPKAVMEPPNLVADGAKFSISWIKSIQKWIESETTSEIHPHDDSGFSEHHDLESRLDEAYSAWSSRLPRTDSEFDDGVTPHARSFSIDSNFSMSSATESVNLDTPASSYGQSDRPPPLHLGILQSYSEEASPTRSIESYLPSPAESDTFFDSTSTHDHADLDQQSQSQQQQQHARNASYAAGSIRSSNRPDFLGKKSMPDLRTAKLNFSKKSVPDTRVDRGFTAKSSSANSPSTSTPTNAHSHRPNLHHPHEDSFSIPSPLSQRQDSTVPSMAFERNSYFRRISSLPTASISNTLPPPLLNLVDTARSILFAVCQIYQTLEHYTLHHTIDDRLSSVLKKVLHPASTDMMQFINSLDRFDAMSRKTVPPPTVCRGVVESCRDTVAVFGKTVGVLSLQLKVIVSVDDLRYVRALLIQLYSAAAEISLAWQGMIPLMDSVKPYLHSKPFPTPSPPNHVGLGNIDNNLYHSPASAPLLPTSLSLSDGSPSHLLSLRANPSGVRTHTARRHAGSFSSKDVEIGKTLPSCEEMPSLSGGIALHTPTLRTPKRKNGSATKATTMLTIQAPSPTGPISFTHSHSRSGSQTSIIAGSSSNPSSSAASSPSLLPPKLTSFLELPSTSRTLVDNEALQAVQAAVEVAPTVWDMIENVLLGNEEGKGVKAGVNLLEMKESLENARAITSRLTECLETMRNKEGGDVGSERKSLREDAHLFLKSVVQLSNAIKIYGGARSSALRTNMVKLTNSTEEFAILLHVSSFSPLPAPTTTNLLRLPELENRGLGLGPALSRSRSAQGSTTSKLPPSPAPTEAPRSAQPLQSFKLPVIRRLRDRETANGFRIDGITSGTGFGNGNGTGNDPG